MKRSLALILSLLFAVFSLATAGCSNSQKASAQIPETLRVGDKTITVEFAITRSEQSKGLMFREGIAEDHGMLFIYQRPQRMSYWMKNVDFPIDIGFFTADGVLREIYPLYPQDTLSRKSIRDDMLYALETRHDWFKDHKIRPGATIDLETVEQALAARAR